MIEIKNLCKTYSLTDGSVEALKDVSLSIPDGDVFGIIGMSGAGKSTLVRCINMLERPTAGSVVIDGKDLTKMTEKELRAERQSITMIFQGFNLLMQKKNAAATGSSAADGTTTSGTTGSPDDGTATTAAQIVSQSLDLDTLLNTGIGKNINIIL